MLACRKMSACGRRWNICCTTTAPILYCKDTSTAVRSLLPPTISYRISRPFCDMPASFNIHQCIRCHNAPDLQLAATLDRRGVPENQWG